MRDYKSKESKQGWRGELRIYLDKEKEQRGAQASPEVRQAGTKLEKEAPGEHYR